MHLVSLVLSLVNIDKCIDSNSEPEKCYPTKSTIHLAHLVKGELLSPEKIRATTGGIVTPPTLPKPHYPTKSTHTLASLKAYRLNKNRSRNTPGAV